MKEPKPGFFEFVCGSQAQGLADIAQHHIGALDVLCTNLKRFGNRLFDQAFLRADAQVTEHDFDNVLGFIAGGAGEQRTKDL